MIIKVLYLHKKVLYLPKQISGYAPAATEFSCFLA